MIGTVLDRKYRITELVGSGGMAQVYKAINMSNRRTVAVKVLKDEYKNDAEFLRRFSREANAILTLSHENIVRAYGAGTHNGMPYLVMEYVEGRTLKDLISQNGALPVRTAIGITCQILDALSAAHAHGIIHRDVKPQNVIVTDKGRVKLADFGIAREVKATTVTFSGQKVLGSVHYISPEQAKGSLANEQSDLYSAGVCLYEMLTGTVPFDADSAVSIALMHIQDKPTPPIILNPELPKALNDIVLKALEKNPNRRYASAMDMREDLLKIYNSLEFDPESEMLPSFVKKLFPAHFIKMTKIIEQAQTEYLMDELFNNIGELEDLDLEEKKKAEEAGRQKEEAEKKRAKNKAFFSKLGLVSGIVAGLAVIALILKFLFVDPDVEVDAVTVFSSPGGAQIFVNGEDTGKVTPASLQLELNKKYIIEFRKDDMIGGLEFTPTPKNRQINMQLKPR